MTHKWHLKDRREHDSYCYHLCVIRIYDDQVIPLRAQEQDVVLHEDWDFLMRHKQICIWHVKNHMDKKTDQSSNETHFVV